MATQNISSDNETWTNTHAIGKSIGQEATRLQNAQAQNNNHGRNGQTGKPQSYAKPIT